MIYTACFILLTGLNGQPALINVMGIGMVEQLEDHSYIYVGDSAPNWEVKESVIEINGLIAECVVQ